MESSTTKPVLFEQGKYQVVQSDPKEGSVFSYDVVNKDNDNIERRESGLGYAIMWTKHLDFYLNKSLTDWDPDKEQEAYIVQQKKDVETLTSKPQASFSFPGTTGPDKKA